MVYFDIYKYEKIDFEKVAFFLLLIVYVCVCVLLSIFQRELANWRWLDGELQTFSFNAWDQGEPDNGDGGEYCAMYDSFSGGWFDARCRKEETGVHVCQSRDGK